MASMLLCIWMMREIALAVVVAACRAGFDEVPRLPPPESRAAEALGNVTPDLVLWYELDDVAGKTVLDISGNELHGNCRTTCPTVIDGYVEHALDFSSITIIDIPALAPLDTFTVTGWIWIPKTATLQCPVRSIAPWRICASPTELRFITGAHTLQVAAPIATETWVHVAVQWDGTRKSIYLDGALLGSVTAAGTTFAERLFVGAFLGHVDDFRVYRRALTAAEVDALYTELL